MENSPKKSSTSAINLVFVGLIVISFLFAGLSSPTKMKAISDASFQGAESAVTLAIKLIGVMALWLGFMRVLEAGGLMYSLAKFLKPVMTKLFKDVPADHPAMGAMILNISANVLGLGNAATPFGIKAMIELNKLNPFPGIATNAMGLFMVVNTSSVTLLPLGVIGVRAAAGSSIPTAIFLPTLIATLCSTIVGVSICLMLSKKDRKYQEDYSNAKKDLELSSSELIEDPEQEKLKSFSQGPSTSSRALSYLMLFVLLGIIVKGAISADNVFSFFKNEFFSDWLMPILMFLILTFGINRRVKIYEAITDGAKQGFDVAVRIIPFLVVILVAIAMFRASGALEFLVSLFDPFTSLIGLPGEALPMAIIRPLSGSGAFAIMSSLVESAPDSYVSYVASTIQGSTETTFYVMAVYFGAVGVTKVRHALVAALCADIAGVVGASLACKILWPSLGLS